MTSLLLPSPIGLIRLSSTGAMLTGLAILAPGDDAAIDVDVDAAPGDAALLGEAAAQLAAYFAGTLTRFDLPIAAPATPAGPRLQAAILAIGYGDTASYGTVARASQSSPRAIGQACRRNPLPILVPCHRILAAGDQLGNYSAGAGPITKRWLLIHEQGARR